MMRWQAARRAYASTVPDVDHTGLFPKLTLAGFRGRAWTTEATRDFLRWLLPDAGAIQDSDVERLNQRNGRRGEPPGAPSTPTRAMPTAASSSNGCVLLGRRQLLSEVRDLIDSHGLRAAQPRVAPRVGATPGSSGCSPSNGAQPRSASTGPTTILFTTRFTPGTFSIATLIDSFADSEWV